MSQSGYTPILSYSSATASAVPLAANLSQGELAINTNDGKLFYKDSAGVVQTMASKATGAIGGSTTQIQFNNAGVLGGSASLTWSGTVLTSSGFAGPLNGTVGATTRNTGAFTSLDYNTTLTGGTGIVNLGSGQFYKDASGNVGIGTSSPTKKLDVYSTTQRGQIAMSGSNVVAIRWNTTDPNAGERNWEIVNNVDAQGALSFRVGASQTADPTTTRMVIDSSGNLLVGTTSAVSGSKLVVASGDATIYGLTVGRGNGAVSTNSVVGTGALAANTSGADVAAFGRISLASNTTGGANSGFGSLSLNANTTGSNNTGIGYGALYLNTTGGSNVAVGGEALRANTTASNNTAVGYQAGYNTTTGATNAHFGYRSGYSGTTGTDNSFFGRESGYQNTGSSNTALGAAALYSSGAGGSNVAVGATAMFLNTSGSQNVAVGLDSLRNNTTASNNTAVGYQAGYSANGANAVSIGYQAGYQNLTGNYSVSVGYQALYGGASADIDRAVAIGAFALKSDTTGDYNVAVGYEALQANTTASNNTAVGYQAGYANTTGQYNTFIGQQAGLGNTTGQQNTFVGVQSGGLVTTGIKNTILGGYNGNQGGLDIRTANNYIVLSDGDGNPRGIFDGSGNFLVGKTSQNVGVVGFEASPAGQVRSTTSTSTNADLSYALYSTGAAAYRFYVGLGGTVYATSTTITSISDQRFKENIRDLDDGLATVMALKPRKFDWKTGKGKDIKNDRGFIAQEFEQVLPDMIEEWRDPAPEGEEAYKAINANLIPTLVKAIQEQQALIQDLTTRLAALEAK